MWTTIQGSWARKQSLISLCFYMQVPLWSLAMGHYEYPCALFICRLTRPTIVPHLGQRFRVLFLRPWAPVFGEPTGPADALARPIASRYPHPPQRKHLGFPPQLHFVDSAGCDCVCGTSPTPLGGPGRRYAPLRELDSVALTPAGRFDTNPSQLK